MTRPTTAEVCNGSKEPTVMEIGGFRGGLSVPTTTTAPCSLERAIDRRPRLIARCIGTADVVATVRFALQIAIRGGGHNVTTTAASG